MYLSCVHKQLVRIIGTLEYLQFNAILKRILAPLYQDSTKRALVSSLYPNRKKDAFLTVNQFYAKVRIAARSKQQCRETRR